MAGKQPWIDKTTDFSVYPYKYKKKISNKGMTNTKPLTATQRHQHNMQTAALSANAVTRACYVELAFSRKDARDNSYLLRNPPPMDTKVHLPLAHIALNYYASREAKENHGAENCWRAANHVLNALHTGKLSTHWPDSGCCLPIEVVDLAKMDIEFAKYNKIKSIPEIQNPDPSYQPQITLSDGFFTQKAHGVSLLKSGSHVLRPKHVCFWPKDFRTLAQARQKLVSSSTMFNNSGVFIRPCPKSSKHGFVDSREVFTEYDFQQLVQETLAIDPEAEFIAMPKIDATWSAICTSSGISFGAGNDGATDGTSGLLIPMHNNFQDCSGFGRGMPDSYFQNAQYVYFEYVAARGKSYPKCVQTRIGPQLPTQNEWVDREFVVENVCDPHIFSMLQWEAEAKAQAKIPNSVVCIPSGTLSSHYAVHAVLNKIPVVCGRSVNVGEKLIPTPELNGVKLSLAARKKLVRYINYAFKSPCGFDNQQQALIAIAAFHSQMLWGEDDYLLKLRAIGIASLLRCLTASCVGEMRHWWECGPGANRVNLNPVATLENHFKAGKNKYKRDAVYKNVQSFDMDELYTHLEQSLIGFDTEGWNGGSFGGMRWAVGTRATIKFFDCVIDFLASPSPANYKKLLLKWNFAVAAAHNNGKLLDKHLGKFAHDTLDTAPWPGFLTTPVYDIISNPKSMES